MRGSLVLGFLVTLSALAIGHEGDDVRQKRLYPTRCYPGSHCFPDQEEIEIFKDSIDGSVIVPSDAEYPASVTSTNLRWTRNPGIVVQADSVEDVRKTVLFARHFFLNLVYSSSGVDYVGRGNYDGSLKLDLSRLKDIQTSNLQSNSLQGTVSGEVGSTWGELYQQVENVGFPRALAGGSASQERVDNFVLTGGLGPISRSLGLAADNLISAKVVLANGYIADVTSAGVTVTDDENKVKTYDDQEMFKAIKGGGQGFAIPVAFTFNVQNAPGSYSSITNDYKIIDDGNVVARSTLRSILSNMAALPFQWGGYVSIDGSPDTTVANDRGSIKYHLLSYGNYDFNAIQNRNNAVDNLRNLAGNNPTTNTRSSLSQYRSAVSEQEQHFTQKDNSYVMNALMGSDVISNATKLDELVELMMDTVNSPTANSNWRCVARLAGGKVSDANNAPSYVNPRLRDALFSWTCALMWTEGVTREDYYIAQALEFQSRLRAVSNGGVDGYYASEDMEDWKHALYGANYYKLLDIKKRYDIDNYLWAHNAVASDFELNCRGIRCPHNH